MPEAFGHRYEVLIGDTEKFINQAYTPTGYQADLGIYLNIPFVTRTEGIPAPLDYTISEDNKVRRITSQQNLQFTASIPYGLARKAGTTPNTAKLSFHNLSDDVISDITTRSSVMVSAGYDTVKGLPVIFVGNVRKVSTKGNVTTVEAVEGADPMKDAMYNKKFKKNATWDDVFDDMAKAFASVGTPLGKIQRTKRSALKLNHPYSFTGKLGQALTDACHYIAYRFFISKNRLYIRPIDEDYLEETVVLSPQNIIGKIEEIEDKEGKSNGDNSSNPRGIKFKIILNGEVGLESAIIISQGKYAGSYVISKLIFKLNYHNGPWQAEIEAREVKPPET